MKQVNQITKGLISDIDLQKVSNEQVIVSVNGNFTGNNNKYVWENLSGTSIFDINYEGRASANIYKIYYAFRNKDKVIAFCKYNATSDIGFSALNAVAILEISLNLELLTLTYTALKIDPINANFQWDDNTVFINAKINYESDTIVRLYWGVQGKGLFSVNLSEGLTSDISEAKYNIDYKYGYIRFNKIIDGSLKFGGYYYCYRLYANSGASTDWSIVEGPIIPPNKKPDGSFSGYHSTQAESSNGNTTSGIKLTINDIDTRYDFIQLACIYSNDFNIYSDSYIAFDGKISGASMDIDHISSDGFESITVQELTTSSITLKDLGTFDIIKNQLVLSNLEEDDELPETTIFEKNKVNGVVLTIGTKSIPSDMRSLNDQVGVNFETGSRYINQLPLNGHSSIDSTLDDLKGTDGLLNGSITVDNGKRVLKFKKYINNQGTFIYDSIDFGDDYFDYKGAVLSTYMRSLWLEETYRVGMLPIGTDGKMKGIRWLGDVKVGTNRNTDVLWEKKKSLTGYDDFYFKVRHLIVTGLDITDLVDDETDPSNPTCLIQGFHIVIAPRDKQILNEGILTPTVANDEKTDTSENAAYNIGLLPNLLGNDNVAGINDFGGTIDFIDAYYSPDLLLNFRNEDFIIGDKLLLTAELKPIFTDTKITHFGKKDAQECTSNDYYPGAHSQDNNYIGAWFNKFYELATTNSNSLWLRKEVSIRAKYDFDRFLDYENKYNDVHILSEKGTTFLNAMRSPYSILITEEWAYGCPVRLFYLDDIKDSNGDYLSSKIYKTYARFKTDRIMIASQKRPKSNLYNGTSDQALQNTAYCSTWHYQKIDTATLLAIKNGQGRYIFNEMDVFGGDTYINSFGFNRLSLIRLNDEKNYADSVIVGLQSNVNSYLKINDVWERKRAFDPVTNTSGIGQWINSDTDFGVFSKLENFSCPNYTATRNVGANYFTLPVSKYYTNKFMNRFQWTSKKIPGEKIDKFRIFPAVNYLDVEGTYGSVVRLFEDKNNIVFFQNNAIGIIPVDQREVIPDQFGAGLQIGRSDSIQEYEYISTINGIYYHNDVEKYPYGYVFFDMVDRTILLFENGKIIPIADQTLNKTLIRRLDITSVKNIGYDTDKHLLLLNAIYNGTRKTILYNYMEKIFVGEFYDNVQKYLSFQNALFNIDKVNGKLNKYWSSGYNSYNGELSDSKIAVVINDNPTVDKVFKTIQLLGNLVPFTSIRVYKLDNTYDELEIIANNNGEITNEFFKFEKGKLVGSIPLQSETYDSIRGQYVIIEFTVSSALNKLVQFNNLITEFTNDY